MTKAEILKELWIQLLPEQVGWHNDGQMVDGQWYSPRFGCNTLQAMLDDMEKEKGGE